MKLRTFITILLCCIFYIIGSFFPFQAKMSESKILEVSTKMDESENRRGRTIDLLADKVIECVDAEGKDNDIKAVKYLKEIRKKLKEWEEGFDKYESWLSFVHAIRYTPEEYHSIWNAE